MALMNVEQVGTFSNALMGEAKKADRGQHKMIRKEYSIAGRAAKE